MPKGGEITIETGIKPEGVSVIITDTGEGMSPDTASRIFEPFFTTRGYATGKGLGLCDVHNIMHEHSGTVAVHSTKLGEGSCFEIILPFHDFSQDDENKAKSLSKMTPNILWVDDEALIREIGFDMLESLNYDATMAESGKQALEFMANNDYDILLSDIGMPEMDGWQLISKVHELYPKKMKIVVISGWGAQITDEQIAKHQVNCVLPKPVKMSELKKVIEEVLAKS
jgi:CheY-like chemotaxis protein